MNESQDEPRKLPDTVLDDSYSQAIIEKNRLYHNKLKPMSKEKEDSYLNYTFKPFATPKFSIQDIDKMYNSMWESDFSRKQNHMYGFSGFKESSPCAEAQVSEKPKPGHLLIQLREGEEYATDYKESI